jgi:hypothetical protein
VLVVLALDVLVEAPFDSRRVGCGRVGKEFGHATAVERGGEFLANALADGVAVVIGEELMVGEQHQAASLFRRAVGDELVLVAVEVALLPLERQVVVPGGIEPDDVPARQLQVEPAGRGAVLGLPATEARIGEQRVEVAAATGVHVMVAIEAPGTDLPALALPLGPLRRARRLEQFPVDVAGGLLATAGMGAAVDNPLEVLDDPVEQVMELRLVEQVGH